MNKTFDEFKETLQIPDMPLSESSLKAIQKMYNEHDTGTISAFSGKEIVSKDHQRTNKVLKAKLLALGYGVTAIKGAWFENGDKEVSEASFFVVDIADKGNLKKDLIKLGKENNQDAITFAPKGGDYVAISTNTCPDSYPGFGVIGKEEKLGTPKFGKTGIYGFSKVNNRAFVFESVVLDKMSNRTINERNSILAMAGMLNR